MGASDDGLVGSTTPWTLGFLEEVSEARELLRHKFPSKVGGRPAWLHPAALPSQEELSCINAGVALHFLLQVYCPLDENPAAFHRTIFLFAPREGKPVGGGRAVRGFRCQLPLENEFYDPVPSEAEHPRPLQGTGATPSADPWQVQAAERCIAEGRPLPPPKDRHLFPEWRLVTDVEHRPPAIPAAAESAVGEEAVQSSDFTPDVEAAISSATSPEQKHFADFAARISWDPEQVLRYCFEEGAQPLWPSPAPLPREEDIPCCPVCSSPRRFEFQVLPQLLNYLGLDDDQDNSLDFGAIAVYSCAQSCRGPTAYMEEYVWVQPP